MKKTLHLNKDYVLKIIKLGRLPFVLGGFLTFSAGAMLAFLLNGAFTWEKYALGYLVLFLGHLSASYSNDYFDWKADQFNQPTAFAGGSGVLVENPELLNLSKKISLTLIFSSILLALLFSFLFSSPLFLLVAVFGNLLAWYYSAPPLELSYRGYGEIVTMLTGFIFPVMGYITLTGYIDVQILIFTIPFMLYQLLFIITVEIPDEEADEKVGKKTYIVRYGREKGFITILALSLSGAGLFLLLALTNLFSPINFNIIAILSGIPLIVSLATFLNRTSQKEKATQLVNYIILSLVLLLAAVDIYFLSLIIGL